LTKIDFLQNSARSTSVKLPQLRIVDTDSINIPIPPLPVQQKIVTILDKFDTLVNDLSIGLPAEIKLRGTQYEYYRNQLLNFKEKQSVV